jgi:hypothetical protein
MGCASGGSGGAGGVSNGDMLGPVASTVNAIPRFVDGSGKVLKDSKVLISDADGMSIPGQLTINNNGANSSSFPTTRGTSGHLLQTNGAGTLSWVENSANNTAETGGVSAPSGTIAAQRTAIAKIAMGNYKHGRIKGIVSKYFASGGEFMSFEIVTGHNPGNGPSGEYSLRIYSNHSITFSSLGPTLYLYRDAAGAAYAAVDFQDIASVCSFSYEPSLFGTMTFPWSTVDASLTLVSSVSTVTKMTTHYNDDGTIKATLPMEEDLPLVETNEVPVSIGN